MHRIKVDDLRGIRPGYDVRVPYFGAVLEGPYDDILLINGDEITFKVGANDVTLTRDTEIGIFNAFERLNVSDAVCLWEDTVGDSGDAPSSKELHDYTIAVFEDIKVDKWASTQHY
jgi:hypothetical protein